jgi:hypothetical protein
MQPQRDRNIRHDSCKRPQKIASRSNVYLPLIFQVLEQSSDRGIEIGQAEAAPMAPGHDPMFDENGAFDLLCLAACGCVSAKSSRPNGRPWLQKVLVERRLEPLRLGDFCL